MITHELAKEYLNYCQKWRMPFLRGTIIKTFWNEGTKLNHKEKTNPYFNDPIPKGYRVEYHGQYVKLIVLSKIPDPLPFEEWIIKRRNPFFPGVVFTMGITIKD